MFRTFVITAMLAAVAAGPAMAQRYASNSEPEYSNSSGKYSRSYKSGDRNGTSAPGRTYNPDYVSHGTYRQPTSLVLIDGTHALITTKLTGEIYSFNTEDQSISLAFSDGHRQFQRIIQLDGDMIAVTDTLNNELVVCRFDQKANRCIEVAVTKIAGGSNGLYFDPVASELWVTSAWAQRLYRFDVDCDGDQSLKHASLTLIQSIDLPMCGGQVLCLPGSGVVMVTDAFGCEYVMLDQTSGDTINHAELYEHNICELAMIDDGKAVLFPQQLLNGLTAALESDITWGNFLSNNVRIIATERLVKHTGSSIYTGSKFLPIGEFGNGAGDPTSMAMNGRNDIAVTVGGTNQLAIGTLDGLRFRFVDLGFRPIDCEFTPDGKTVIVINQFSDSISLVDLETRTAEHVALGALRPTTETEHGEMLFHDSTLSHDSWMSCQSCHTGGHTNGLLTDNFTDKSYRSPKRVLSLLGQAETSPYSWAGTMQTLEDQVAFSIKSTMASDEAVRSEDVDHLSQYVRTLKRPPSIVQARTDAAQNVQEQAGISRGKEFFAAAGCLDCHGGSHYTNTGVFDVGMSDERELREFNPPSLVAVSQRQNSLFHDGRAKSIHDVVIKENHQMPSDATDDQRLDLIHFLMSL